MKFKNLEKIEKATFLKMRKKSTISKISIVWCFSSRTDQFVTIETSFYFLKTIFSL